VEIAGGPADGVEVRLPGVTSTQYRRVKELAEAGRIDAPEIICFVRAFAELIGHDLGAVPWTDADTWGFLKWLGLVEETVWTGLEEAELALLLREGASDV
jgi:hypothetical protein